LALLGAAEVLDIIEESADEGAAALMSEAAGVAMALLSGAALAVESVVLSVLLAGCEQPASARPAMAARMARVEAIGTRRAEGFKGGIRELRLDLAKTLAAQSCSKR
jgi:hypothetical protein